MIFIDDNAYKEFKELLDSANVDSYKVRIFLDRVGCREPVFGLYIDEANEEDDVQVIKDISFILEKSLLEEYGGFIIVSSEENEGKGLGMKAVVTSVKESNCASACGGACH